MESKKVIHVYLKSEDKHLYFGSVKAIYQNLTSEQIGCSYDSLVRRGFSEDPNKFENSRCIIRKGEIIRMNSQEVKERRIES